MRKKALIALIAAAVILLLPLTAAAAPIITTETQFTYSTSNPAWLKDLIVKENMVSPTELANSVTLEALPDYPYSKTPEGFRSDVEYYTQLYSLNENSQRAAYIYVLQYVNSFANEATRNVSDEYIKNTLTAMGIVYPPGGMGDYENLIFARTLYTLLCSGAVTLNVTEGMTVQQALVACMTQTFHIDEQMLAAWSVGSVDTLDDYVLAACKIALNSDGYNVRADTAPEEVYRLTAVMMIRRLGISIDEDTADFEELKLKYLAALLSTHYDVSIPPSELKTAMETTGIPFYLLQLIGKENGVTVRSDLGYSEAFNLVASNSDYFSLEPGEFYADIYNYAVHLQHKRSRIWVSPQAYRTTTATEIVTITVDGASCASGAYAEVALDKNQETQDVLIRVRFVSASQDVSQTYRITVYQGRYEASGGDNLFVTTDPNGNSPTPTAAPADPEIAAKAMLGSLTGTLAESAANANVPERITNILTLMSPSTQDTAVAAQPAGEPGQAAQTPASSPAAGAPDYLSSLMGNSVPSPSAAGTGVGTPANSTTVPAGSVEPSSAVQNPLFASGTPMTLAEAGAPPEGYEYVVNEEGYITGVELKKSYAPPAENPTYAQSAPSTTSSRSAIRNLIPVIAIGACAAVCAAVMLISRRRKHSS